MLCKHFKGRNLLEKNIYKIIKVGVDAVAVDSNVVKYTGDGVLESAKDLVIYQNIFQENAYFAREYNDISSVLSVEKQEQFRQTYKVQPLSKEECKMIEDQKFIQEKINSTKKYVK